MTTNLVIGADKGIAHAICLALHQRGEDVIAACLNEGQDLAALGLNVLPGVDVTSDARITAMADRLEARQSRIDVLYHVAGVLGVDRLGALDLAELRRQFEINAMGPVRTVQALVPCLAPGAKIGIVTSRVGSLGDNGSGGMYAYRMSKAAANMAGLNLHHDLKAEGIAVLMLHPGMIATDLTKDIAGDFEFIQPDEAAAGLIRCMDELTLETAGRFRHADGTYLPW